MTTTIDKESITIIAECLVQVINDEIDLPQLEISDNNNDFGNWTYNYSTDSDYSPVSTQLNLDILSNQTSTLDFDNTNQSSPINFPISTVNNNSQVKGNNSLSTTVPTPLSTTVPTPLSTTVPTPLSTTVPTPLITTVPTPLITTVPLYKGITLTLTNAINGSTNVSMYYVQPLVQVMIPILLPSNPANTSIIPSVSLPPSQVLTIPSIPAANVTVIDNSICNIFQFNLDLQMPNGYLSNNITNSISKILLGNAITATLTFEYNKTTGGNTVSTYYDYVIKTNDTIANYKNACAISNNLTITNLNTSTNTGVFGSLILTRIMLNS